MCNLYRTLPSASEIIRWFGPGLVADRTGNEPWPEDVYPDRRAPIVWQGEGTLEVALARWGMPSPPSVLKTQRDPGVTNIRNTASPHWRRWLGRPCRCLVPLAAFSEPGPDRRPVWFELTDSRPAFFAGLCVRDWTSVRKVKDGPTTDDLFGFLTTTPNAEVAEIHPKAMPVILTEPTDWLRWMGASWEEAATLQRPLPDGALRRATAEA